MKSLSKSFLHRMLVSTAIATVSLASAGHAIAASPHHKANLHHRASAAAAPAPYGYQARLDVAAIPPYPNYSSQPTRAPRSRAGYDSAARAPYPQWGGGYPYSQWGGGYPVAQWFPGFPFAGPAIDVRGLIASIQGSVPLHYGGKATASGSGSDFIETPAPDTSAADAAGWAAQQAANDATVAAIQNMNQNMSDMNAQNAAAEAQLATQEANDQQTMTNLVNSQ
jgi:hypothetical protein